MNTSEAKAVLKAAGYYVDNLWHVTDVQERFKADDSEAQDVLDSALTSPALMAHIWEAIHWAAEDDELQPHDE
jgi:hypothetical protein